MWNLWDQILAGFIEILETFVLGLILPPASTSEGLANAVQFVQGTLSGTLIVIQFTAMTLEAFNWVVPLAALAWGLLMIGIAMAVTIVKWIMELLSFAGDLIALVVKFFI